MRNQFNVLTFLDRYRSLLARASGRRSPVPAADVVLTHAKIYTAADPELAEAFAFRQGKLVYVGDLRGCNVSWGASHSESTPAVTL